jgi:hypothetical protein
LCDRKEGFTYPIFFFFHAIIPHVKNSRNMEFIVKLIFLKKISWPQEKKESQWTRFQKKKIKKRFLSLLSVPTKWIIEWNALRITVARRTQGRADKFRSALTWDTVFYIPNHDMGLSLNRIIQTKNISIGVIQQRNLGFLLVAMQVLLPSSNSANVKN